VSTQLATFRLDEQVYGVDVAGVQEVLRSQARTRVPLAPPAIAGLINLRGQVLTAIELREQLGLAPRPDGVEPMVVVIRIGSDPVALLVDSIGAVIDVEDGQFEDPPDTLTGPARDFILGAYKLDDHLLLSLDVHKAVAA
jgi:purine-binding chemotaxis protein CheW